MRSHALVYFNKGYNIVPIALIDDKKKPLVEWKKWQDERQTKDEFEGLPWHDAEAFAIVCGTKIGKYYVGAIDLDTTDPKIPKEARERGEDLRTLFRATQLERTFSKGYHLVYLSEKPIGQTIRRKDIRDHCSAELLGHAALCIMAPSFNGAYKRMNDNMPSEVPDLTTEFWDTLRRVGYKRELPTPRRRIRRPRKRTDVRPCVDELLNRMRGGEELSHEARLCVVSECIASGWPDEELYGIFENLADYKKTNGKITREQVAHIRRGNYKPWRCSTIEHHLWCLPNCPRDFNGVIPPTFYDETTEKVDVHRLASYLMEERTFLTTNPAEQMYCYQPELGVYRENGELVIKEDVVDLLGEHAKTHHYNECRFLIEAQTYFDLEEQLLKNELAVQNGILNVESGTLTEFTPDKFITQKLPVKYDPTAKCLDIEQFIIDVVGKEQLQLVKEFMGYCLYKEYFLDRALMMIGSGANGKSTLQELFERLLGKHNVSSETLQNLCHHRFAKAELFQKLANCCADLPSKALAHTGVFKMLVGGDKVTGERKHKDPFQFLNFAKLIFSANQIPETSDDTTAYFRRWLIISCPNYFPPDRADPHILDKLCTPDAMSGLLNFALEGLHTLLKNKRFSDNLTLEQYRQTYIRKSNSAKAFIEENLMFTGHEEDKILKDDLYREFIAFCHTHKLPTKRKGEFTKNMNEYMPKSEQRRLSKDEGRAWFWTQLVYKDEYTPLAAPTEDGQEKLDKMLETQHKPS